MTKRSKRRQSVSEDDERRAWRRVFACGRDYARELLPLGITTQQGLEAAAPDAWARFGRQWLQESVWRDLPTAWAKVKFGEHRQMTGTEATVLELPNRSRKA